MPLPWPALAGLGEGRGHHSDPRGGEGRGDGAGGHMGLSLGTLFAGVGESQPRQVESWFREGLGTNPAVPVMEVPRSALLWDMPALPELPPARPLAGVVAVSSCSRCVSCRVLQPRDGESLVFSTLPLSLLGRKVQAKKSTPGLDRPGSKAGRALPKGGALLTPAPQVRSLVFSTGLCSCSYFVLREAIKSVSQCSHCLFPRKLGENWVSWAWRSSQLANTPQSSARGWMSAPMAPHSSEPVAPVPRVGVPWSPPAARWLCAKRFLCGGFNLVSPRLTPSLEPRCHCPGSLYHPQHPALETTTSR